MPGHVVLGQNKTRLPFDKEEVFLAQPQPLRPALNPKDSGVQQINNGIGLRWPMGCHSPQDKRQQRPNKENKVRFMQASCCQRLASKAKKRHTVLY